MSMTRVVQRARRPRTDVESARSARNSEMAAALRDAALDLFASRNYSVVTIKDISEAINVNPSLIYYYFGSKEDLFLSAIESLVDDAFEKFNAIHKITDSSEQTISIWIEIHIMQFVILQKLAKISLDYAGTANRTSRIDSAIRKFYDLEAVVLSQAIESGIQKKLFRKVDPKSMAQFISTFLDGTLFRNVMFPTFNYAVAIRHMREIVLEHLRFPRESK